MESNKYSLNREDVTKIGMAIFYSATASALATLAAALAQLTLPPQYMAFVPFAVGILYTAVRFFQGKAGV